MILSIINDPSSLFIPLSIIAFILLAILIPLVMFYIKASHSVNDALSVRERLFHPNDFNRLNASLLADLLECLKSEGFEQKEQVVLVQDSGHEVYYERYVCEQKGIVIMASLALIKKMRQKKMDKRIKSQSRVDLSIYIETYLDSGHHVFTTNNPSLKWFEIPDNEHVTVLPLASTRQLLRTHTQIVNSFDESIDTYKLNHYISQHVAEKNEQYLERMVKSRHVKMSGNSDRYRLTLKGAFLILKSGFDFFVYLLSHSDSEQMDAHGDDDLPVNFSTIEEYKTAPPQINKRRLMKGVFFVLLGLIITVAGVRIVWEGTTIHRWAQTEGIVTLYEVEDSFDSIDAYIRYNYEVHGKSYVGYRFYIGSDSVTKNDAEVDRLTHNYGEIGTEVTVHYNPEDPSKSVLENKLKFSSFFPLSMGIILLLAGIFQTPNKRGKDMD